MKLEKKLDYLLLDLEKNGSDISTLKKIRKECINIIKKDKSMEEAMDIVSDKVKDHTKKMLDSKSKDKINYVSGMASKIYLPSFENDGEINLDFIGGSKHRNMDLPIDKNTLFDLASITKLYTLVLLFKLEELNLIMLDEPLVNIDSSFRSLGNFSFRELMEMRGIIRTDGKIEDARNVNEANKILRSAKLVDFKTDTYNINEIGPIIIGDALEKLFKNRYNIDIKYSELLNKYVLEPYGLLNTIYNPMTMNITGNNFSRSCNDPKTKALGGATAAAGIFSNGDDLAKFAKEIFKAKENGPSIISETHLEEIGNYIKGSDNKGLMGIYLKHPNGFDKTFTPSEYSLGSFSHQGYTGSIVTFDPNNKIFQSILMNAIYEPKSNEKDVIRGDKPVGFIVNASDVYARNFTDDTMMAYLLKKYYNLFCNDYNSINRTYVLEKNKWKNI